MTIATAATIPTGSRSAILHDLTQRREKALELLYAAEDDNNERKWRQATARYWLRDLQIDYVAKMPAEPVCINCVMGDAYWAPDLLLTMQDIYSCLEHWTPALEREAQRIAAAARWFGRGDGDETNL